MPLTRNTNAYLIEVLPVENGFIVILTDPRQQAKTFVYTDMGSMMKAIGEFINPHQVTDTQGPLSMAETERAPWLTPPTGAETERTPWAVLARGQGG